MKKLKPNRVIKTKKTRDPKNKTIDLNTKLLFGKNVGLTPQQIIANGDIDYLKWLYNNAFDLEFSQQFITEVIYKHKKH